jgi:DNA-binding response OmpR family regulator
VIVSRILVVDDSDELRENLIDFLLDADYSVDEAASGAEAIDKIKAEDFDLVLLDLVMPGMNGIDTLVELKKIKPKIKVVMLTAFASVQSAVNAIQKGASDYVTKPFQIEDLLVTLGIVLEESKFESGVLSEGFDNTLSSLSSPIRRAIIRMLHKGKRMRLMEITRALEVEDHTKIVFHLRKLKEAKWIEQNQQKTYSLTPEGEKAFECMKVLENYITES